MEFCEKCGNMLKVIIENGNRFLHCKYCDIKKPLTEEVKIETSYAEDKKEIVVIDEKEKESFPLTKILCPRCGEMREAYWTMQQTRGADEPPTRFYECETCKWRWREYS